VDIALVSCGDVSSHSLLATTQTVREYQHDLEALGTVGDLLGTFLDARGQPIPHRLNQCVMALSPQELKAVAHSILASGGLNKAPVVHAILTGGYVNRLVTDEDCARAILAMPLEKAP